MGGDHGSVSGGDGFCEFDDNSCGNVNYYGGKIMVNPRVLLVFWRGVPAQSVGFDNPTIDPSAVNPSDDRYAYLVSEFVYDLCLESPGGLLALVQQYGDGSGHKIGACSLVNVFNNGQAFSSLFDDGPIPIEIGLNQHNVLPTSDSTLAAEASAAMKFAGLSADDNTIVAIYTPFGIQVNHDCGYHGSFGTGTFGWGAKQIWSIHPDQANTQGAGNNCNMVTTDGDSGQPGMLSVSPNNDPAADAAITSTFHELMEAFTRPQEVGCCTFQTGWIYCPEGLTECASGGPIASGTYGSQGSGEIADLCSGDYPGTQPFDGSDVRLGSDSFRVQSIWSNSNNGCTLDLTGPPISVTETLIPDSSTGATATPQQFKITFQMAGQSSPATTINTYPPSVSPVMTFFMTPNTNVLTAPQAGSASNYCFEFTCSVQTAVMPNPNVHFDANGLTYVYYHLDLQEPFLNLVNSSPGLKPPEVDLSYVTAPAKAGSSDAPQTRSLPLTLTPQQVYALVGSKASVPKCSPTSGTAPKFVCGSNGQRWEQAPILPGEGQEGASCGLGPLSFSTCFSITNLSSDTIQQINYYNQFELTGSYSVVGGAIEGINPNAPTLASTQLGAAYHVLLTTSPTDYWLDASAGWSVTNPLGDAAERWVTRVLEKGSTKFYTDSNVPVSGKVSQGSVVAPEYFHEYYLSVEANPQNGGMVSPNSGWQNPGTPVTISATPNAGWQFTGWTAIGSGSCSSPTCTVTMNGPVVAYANFQLPGALSVTLVSPTNGATVVAGQEFSVSVTSGAAPVQGATVTVFQDGGQVCSGSTNPSGIYTCNIRRGDLGQHTWYATASKTGLTAGTSAKWVFILR